MQGRPLSLGISLSKYRSLDEIINLFKVLTLDLSINLIKTNTELSCLVGLCPFSDDDLFSKEPKILIKYCYKSLANKSDMILSSIISYVKDKSFDFIKKILKIIDFNSGLPKSRDLGSLTREVIAEELIDEEIIQSVSEAVDIMEKTGLNENDFNSNVPYNHNSDYGEDDGEQIMKLCENYIDDNWNDIIDESFIDLKGLIELLKDAEIYDRCLIDQLISSHGIDGVQCAIESGLDAQDVVDELYFADRAFLEENRLIDVLIACGVDPYDLMIALAIELKSNEDNNYYDAQRVRKIIGSLLVGTSKVCNFKLDANTIKREVVYFCSNKLIRLLNNFKENYPIKEFRTNELDLGDYGSAENAREVTIRH